MLTFTIPLPPITKKNHSQIVLIKGKPRIIPSKQYKQYEKDTRLFMPIVKEPINTPVNIKALYFMPTKRRVDLINLHSALHDILVTHGIIEDDNSNIVVSTDGSRVLYDKENPRTEICIKEV